MSNYITKNKDVLKKIITNELDRDESLVVMKDLHKYYKTVGFDEDFCLLNQDQRNRNIEKYEKFARSVSEGINEIIYAKYKLNTSLEDEDFDVFDFNLDDVEEHNSPSINFTALNINKFIHNINTILTDENIDDERKREIRRYFNNIMSVLNFTIGSKFTDKYYSTFNVNVGTIYEPFVFNFYSLYNILRDLKNLKLVNVMDDTYMCDKIYIGSILLTIYKHSDDYYKLYDSTVKIFNDLSDIELDFVKEDIKEFHELLLVELGNFLESIPKWFEGVVYTKPDMRAIELESSNFVDILPLDISQYYSVFKMYKVVSKIQLSSKEIPQTIYYNVTQLDSRVDNDVDVLNKHLANLFNLVLNLPDSPTDRDYLNGYDNLSETLSYSTSSVGNLINDTPDIRIDIYSKVIVYLHDSFFQFNNPTQSVFNDDDYTYHSRLYNKSNLYKTSYDDRYKDLDSSYNDNKDVVTFGHDLLSDTFNNHHELLYNLYNGLRNYITNEGLLYGYGNEQVQDIVDVFTTIQNNMINDNMVKYKSCVIDHRLKLQLIKSYCYVTSIELIDIPCKGNNNKLKVKFNHNIVEVTDDDVIQ